MTASLRWAGGSVTSGVPLTAAEQGDNPCSHGHDGGGVDTPVDPASAAGVIVNLGTGALGAARGDTIPEVEKVIGSLRADITGDSGGSNLQGDAGAGPARPRRSRARRASPASRRSRRTGPRRAGRRSRGSAASRCAASGAPSPMAASPPRRRRAASTCSAEGSRSGQAPRDAEGRPFAWSTGARAPRPMCRRAGRLQAPPGSRDAEAGNAGGGATFTTGHGGLRRE